MSAIAFMVNSVHINNMEKEKLFLIEVRNKTRVTDVFGYMIKKDIMETGIQEIEEVLTSSLYRLKGVCCHRELIRIAEEILIDAVAQDYFLDNSGIRKRGAGYNVIDVFYKEGVTDTVAETVMTAVKDAGIKNLFSASTGKRYYLKGRLNRQDIETICMKVLVNPLIQNYSVVKDNNA